jgi:hypothetical protein
MATSFFNGAFFGGEFFNTPVTPVSSGPGDAGVVSARKKRRRKILVGNRMYEVDSLSDVELILKRVVRDETDAEPVKKAAKSRVRVVDRITAKLDPEPSIAAPIQAVEVDWSGLWAQLALQDRAYADALVRILERQEEDDIETIVLLH